MQYSVTRAACFIPDILGCIASFSTAFFRQDDYYPESVSLPNLHQRNAAMYKVKVGGMKSVENDSSDDNGIRPYMVCSYMAYLRPLLRYRV